ASTIRVKIFLGCRQNGEIKMHLNQSESWQRSKLLNEQLLSEAWQNEKEYIGVWLDAPLSLQTVKNAKQEVKTQLQLYCPKLKLDPHAFFLFPQAFIG
ncbi:MAG: hypothetical protein ACHQUC_10025, partial [Chlamydiales bacterium]